MNDHIADDKKVCPECGSEFDFRDYPRRIDVFRCGKQVHEGDPRVWPQPEKCKAQCKINALTAEVATLKAENVELQSKAKCHWYGECSNGCDVGQCNSECEGFCEKDGE